MILTIPAPITASTGSITIPLTAMSSNFPIEPRDYGLNRHDRRAAAAKARRRRRS